VPCYCLCCRHCCHFCCFFLVAFVVFVCVCSKCVLATFDIYRRRTTSCFIIILFFSFYTLCHRNVVKNCPFYEIPTGYQCESHTRGCTHTHTHSHYFYYYYHYHYHYYRTTTTTTTTTHTHTFTMNTHTWQHTKMSHGIQTYDLIFLFNNTTLPLMILKNTSHLTLEATPW